MKRKNILLIISDQHRQDAMGLSGNPIAKTPHMDRLFSRGVSFDNALSPAPLCGPARASLFTGMYPHQAKGILEEENLGARDDMEFGMERDMMINSTSLREAPHLTQAFKKDGYYTAYAGKWHLGNDIITDWFDDCYGYDNTQYTDWLKEKGLSPRGWSLNDPEVRSKREPPMSIPVSKASPVKGEEYNDAWITDIALNYIQGRPQEDPFFICCGFNGPHPPFMIPEPWYSMYDPEEIPEPVNFHPADGEPECKGNSFYRQLWKDHGENWNEWKKSMAVYYGFVSYIDHQIGRLIDELETEGVLDDTLIVYTSDHGEMLGSHGLWHKMQAYEESLRVPLIFSSPGLAQGKHCSQGASLLDVSATILSQSGYQVSQKNEGLDLSPWLYETQTADKARLLFAEQSPLGQFHKENDWRMVTDNHFKYIWNLNDSAEFYDLKADRAEIHNLSGTSNSKELESHFRSKLEEWMKESGDPLTKEILQERGV